MKKTCPILSYLKLHFYNGSCSSVLSICHLSISWRCGGSCENCKTQHPASIGWVALSSIVRWRCPASVTSSLTSTIWCVSLKLRPYKPCIFCEDMILTTCQRHHILIWWSSYTHVMMISSYSRKEQTNAILGDSWLFNMIFWSVVIWWLSNYCMMIIISSWSRSIIDKILDWKQHV